MEREKQIEELTNIIMTIQTIYHEKASSEQIAQGLVNANCRIVEQGSVVLTEEESKYIQPHKVLANATLKGLTKAELIEHIRLLEHNWASAKWFNANQAKNFEILEKEIKDQARKEAVKEVLDRAYDWGQDFFFDYTFMEEDDFNGMLNNLAKEFELDIKE